MRLTIRGKVTLALMATVIGAVVTLALVLVREAREDAAEQTRALELAVASEVATALRHELDPALDTLTGVARHLGAPPAGLAPDATDTDRVRAQIAAATAVLSVSDAIDHAAVYAPDGHLLDVLRQPAATVATPATLDARSRQAADAASERAGGAVPITEHDAGVLLVAALPGAEPHGYVAAVLPVRRFASRVAGIAHDRGLAVSVTDDQWRVLADSSNTSRGALFDGRQAMAAALPRDATGLRVGAVVDFTHAGVPSVGIAETLAELGWRVVVTRARSEVYASVRELERRMGLTAGAIVLVILALNALLGHWLTRPVRALTEGVRRFGDGDFKQRVVVESRDELADLAAALNTMADDIVALRAREREQDRVREQLARYLPGEVVDRVVLGQEHLALGGTRRDVVVLFADVVGFTRLSQKLPPEQVVALLNELFTYLTDIVFKHGGMVDKFVGDCVMAVWGVRDGSTPAGDVAAALDATASMMSWLAVGNARWRERYGLSLQLGIGVHAGEAVVGNLGSDRRMEFTVIGHTVNVAARLEAIAPPDTVLVSEVVHTLAADEGYEFEHVGERTLRGQDEAVEVYAFRYA